jgi:predicted HicB family RNase H-like nuclease
LNGIRKVVAKVIEDLRANGETIPEPLASRRFSGKFMVRVPPEVHRHLAVEAAEAGVSLNRLVGAKLSR